MKISGITPQFVFEKPAGEETTEANRLADRLHEKTNRAESAHDSTSKENLDQETREGLKRFLKLVKKSKESSPTKTVKAAPGVLAYRNVLRFEDGCKAKGSLINKKC